MRDVSRHGMSRCSIRRSPKSRIIKHSLFSFRPRPSLRRSQPARRSVRQWTAPAHHSPSENRRTSSIGHPPLWYLPPVTRVARLRQQNPCTLSWNRFHSPGSHWGQQASRHHPKSRRLHKRAKTQRSRHLRLGNQRPFASSTDLW